MRSFVCRNPIHWGRTPLCVKRDSSTVTVRSLFHVYVRAWLICFWCVNLSRQDVHSWALTYIGLALNGPPYCIFTVVEKSLNLWENGLFEGHFMRNHITSKQCVWCTCVAQMLNQSTLFPCKCSTDTSRRRRTWSKGTWVGMKGGSLTHRPECTGRAAEVRQIKDAFLCSHILSTQPAPITVHMCVSVKEIQREWTFCHESVWEQAADMISAPNQRLPDSLAVMAAIWLRIRGLYSAERKVFTGTSSCLCVKEERFPVSLLTYCMFIFQSPFNDPIIHRQFFFSVRAFLIVCICSSLVLGRGSNEVSWRPDFYMQYCFFI